MKKTILMVLDGLDHEYIRAHLDELPCFRRLAGTGSFAALESVIPADSIPAWNTIYTGQNPAQHGILDSIDYLQGRDKLRVDSFSVAGRTLWDELGRRGRKVFVFNPFMAYPAWEVNGLMICGPVFEGGEPSTNRPGLVDTAQLPPIGGIVDHPNNKEMEAFFQKNMRLTQQQFDAFHRWYGSDDYDFAFLGITTPDRIQHFLWRYTDPQDRTFPKRSRLRSAVLEMYQLLDHNVQAVLERYGEQCDVVVISDHGHGRRCEKTFYINQWLIGNGFIKQKSRKHRFVEYAKNTAFFWLAALHIVEPGTRFFKKFRFAHRVKNADYVFLKKKEAIYAPKFDGCNPFGGICVERSAYGSEEEYETVRQRLIDGLLQVKDGDVSVVLWAKRREELYTGERIGVYPDIVYMMRPEYGVDRGLFGRRLFGISAMHEVISGGHRLNGVILSNRRDAAQMGSVLRVRDYILRIAAEETAPQ